LHKFNFAKDQALNVYADTVMLLVPVTIEPGAPLGEQHLALKLRYQACNNEVCLPPVTLPVDAVIHVSSGESRPSHPELFAKPYRKRRRFCETSRMIVRGARKVLLVLAASFLTLLILLFAVAAAKKRSAELRTRDWIVRLLEQKFQSNVELADFHVRVFP